jgi:hypothetical protein
MHGPRSETPAACGAQEFYNHLREVDRENEVNRILGAFKLNPFEQLGVKFTVTPEDVRRAYRKVRPGRHERAAGPLAPRGHADVPPPRRLTSAAVPLLRTAGIADGAPGQMQARARQGRFRNPGRGAEASAG